MKGGGRSRYTKTYTEPINKSGSGGATEDSCNSISFTTQLQNVTDLIIELSVSDELEIIAKKNVLKVFDRFGKECGSIVSNKNDKLLECMKRNYSYKAIVKSISGRVCKVNVQISK